jgi:starch phosphorylase
MLCYRDTSTDIRLKQEYFLAAASVRDIVVRFTRTFDDWTQFSERNVIHVNDSQTALAPVELLRILLDEVLLPWDEAYRIVLDTTVCTRHSVHGAEDTWPVDMLKVLLPRHLELIYMINFYLIESLKPHLDASLLQEISIVVEGPPKQVKFGSLCFVLSNQVNGVS